MFVNLAAGLFSAGQIAGIVILSVVIAALIALNVYLAVLLRRRGEHKLHTKQLQQQREALLEKLNTLRSGVPLEEYDDDDEDEEEDEDETAVSDEPEDEADAAVSDESEEESIDVEVDEKGSVVRYNRSFTARITQASDEVKGRYSELKNYILSFGGVRSRISWRHEKFSIKNRAAATFVMRGKTLCLCLATDPAMFKGTKYNVEAVRGNKNTTPCMYRVKSKRKTAYAKELIDIVMAGFDTVKNEAYEQKDYFMPYQSTYTLIKRMLIKVIGEASDIDKEEALAAYRGIRYIRSFEAKLAQSDGELKARYSKLKNRLLSYSKISCLRSWKHESFRYKKGSVALLLIRGKTLCLCLAGNPDSLEGTKYAVEDLSLKKKTVSTPILYRIKSNRRLNYALQLIDTVFKGLDLEMREIEEVDYTVPFVPTEELINAGLIRVTEIKHKINYGAAAEAAATDSGEKVE